jgi:pectin methylesterase-like acyl-CoA thioesterase
VGYYAGDKTIPDVPVVKTIEPAVNGTSEMIIQSAIDEVSKRTPDKDGFRGTILLKKGTYKIPEEIKIETSGIVLRGEGNDTRLVAQSKKQVSLINVSGKGNITEIKNSRVKITG